MTAPLPASGGALPPASAPELPNRSAPGAALLDPRISPLKRDLLIAHLAAAGVAAHVLEAALPGLGPWFKPGLANAFTLVAFFHLGWRAAAAVSLIRVLAASLALGTFLSPTFLMSLSGALAAVAAMGLGRWIPGNPGPVGVSVLAALAHMSAQVVMAWLAVIGHAGVFLALPWFLAGSWVTGIINGVLAFLVLERLAAHQQAPRRDSGDDPGCRESRGPDFPGPRAAEGFPHER